MNYQKLINKWIYSSNNFKSVFSNLSIFLTYAINIAISDYGFPDKRKKLEVIPLYKKQGPLKKENYLPISLLPHVSKVFERILKLIII